MQVLGIDGRVMSKFILSAEYRLYMYGYISLKKGSSGGLFLTQ
jgi:hypothetical protein